jgi:hypothetical protein
MGFDRTLAAVIVIVGCVGCVSSPPPQQPEVTQRTKTTVWYRGPEIRAELAYSWANRHLGDRWLVLKLSLAATGNASPVIERDAVTVQTPDGYTLPLVDQDAFRRIEGELRVALDRIDAWGPPSGRFIAFETPCELWFIAPRGTFADRSSLRIVPTRWCSGPLVFEVPLGVQPGPWQLRIDLEESDVRVPFVLGD